MQSLRKQSIVAVFLLRGIIFCDLANGQEQNVSASWIKASPNSGNQFAKYSSELGSYRLQYRRTILKNFLVGGGVERMEFRLSALPPHKINTTSLFIQGGYRYKLDAKMDLIGLLYLGYTLLDYSLEQNVSYIETSKQLGPAAGVSISMMMPLSKRVSFQPEIGYSLILHKLSGFTTTDPVKFPAENTDAHFGFWVYRVGVGYNF